MLFRTITLLLCAILFSTTTFAKEPDAPAPINFLTLSDIHFDPFVACYTVKQRPCPMIAKLNEAPASEWPTILSQYDLNAPQYRQDSNYTLLVSALTAAKKTAQESHVKFVVVLGDFLGHDYRRYYIQYSGDRSVHGYQKFVEKTMQFLTTALHDTFPHLDVYSVVGNNDSYRSDYYSNANGAFFKEMGQMWSGLISTPANRAAIRRDFPAGGYYSVDIPNLPQLRLIVLNSVLFSNKAEGKNVDAAAIQQLNWLQNQLAEVKRNHQHALIAMHIPAGIDVYATLKYRFRLIELWKRPLTERFEAILKNNAPEVVGILAGHLHADWFQVLTLSNENSIPVSGTPSISPIFGNNPGYKIYTYSPSEAKIIDFETYYSPIDTQISWNLEYDFNQIYQKDCKNCGITDGMHKLAQEGHLANYYKHFYAVGTESQPISTKWNPYYWCATRETDGPRYKKCLSY